MEKQQAKSKKKKILMSFLPKAVSFQNPSFSPAREARPDNISSHKPGRPHNSSSRKGYFFSGPILPMTPAAARRRPSRNFEPTAQEPTSPKVSCMGQIKHKKSRVIICSKKKKADETRELKKKPSSSGIEKIFKADHNNNKEPITDRAPSLSQMRRFASGRESTLANFDFCYATHSQERGFCSEGYSDDGEDDVVVIPFSAPILLAGAGGGGSLSLEPRKEINLWKRRTMTQPHPLQLSLIN